jgi:hypothetical protein
MVVSIYLDLETASNSRVNQKHLLQKRTFRFQGAQYTTGLLEAIQGSYAVR